jgi:serine/threonine protein kinase
METPNQSFELSPTAGDFFNRPEERVAEFLENIEHDIPAFAENVIRREEVIGEGRVGKVFSLTNLDSPCRIAAKIWRHKPLYERVIDTKNSKDVWYEYKKLQFLEPREEYRLQADLWAKGFRDMPCPIAYVETPTADGPRKVFAMEQIVGYTLHDIMATPGCVIVEPTWKDLANIILRLHRDFGVIHRDIKPDNIMLETDQPLEPGTQFKGKIKIIDFGRSKKFYGSGSPAPEDYSEGIALDLPPINYSNDADKLEQMKVRGKPFFNLR